MQARFSLLEGRGWLTVTEQQGRVICKGEMPDDKKGLYKGWLTGVGGKVLIGTFIPEGGMLRLERTLNKAELERQGAWPPTGGYAVLAYTPRQGGQRQPPPGWSWTADPARLLGEALLVRAWEGGGALLRKEEQGFLLARKFSADRPFPLPPMFCFARIMELGGELYLVFPFRSSGCPRLD